MNVIKFTFYLLIGSIIIPATAAAQSNSGEKIKHYINEITQKAEQAEDPEQKREILDRSFDKILQAVTQAEMLTSSENLNGTIKLKESIEEKKNELNGRKGFERVEDEQLDEFIDYVQQDLEQANTTITLGVGVAVIIAILLLML